MATQVPLEPVDLEKKIEQSKRRFRPSGIITFKRTYRRTQYQNGNNRQRNFRQGQQPRNRQQYRFNDQNRRNRNDKRSEEQVGSRDPQPNVIIKGLGGFITDNKLKELCQEFGPMDMCKLDRDSFGNVKPQGIGLVKYEKIEDAKKMISELDGAKIVEDEDHPNGGGQISVKLVNPYRIQRTNDDRPQRNDEDRYQRNNEERYQRKNDDRNQRNNDNRNQRNDRNFYNNNRRNYQQNNGIRRRGPFKPNYRRQNNNFQRNRDFQRGRRRQM